MAEITHDDVRNFLAPYEGKKITLPEMRNELGIQRGTKSFNSIRKIVFDLARDKMVKATGVRGEYKVLTPIEPVEWWNDDISEDPIDFKFPCNHNEDEESFGLEECVEIFPGDMVLITGVSNYGKTTLALSMLGENLSLMPSILMGSEYTASDGKISPKFKRRMRRMTWVEWMVDGEPKFQLYPVGSDYEDYVQSDSINVIDWISLPGDYFLIDRVMKSIKDRVGNGVAVVVLQKNPGQEFGEGGPRTERYADVVMRVDPYGSNESMMTLGKVKAPKGKATGRSWAFEIIDYGANICNIREVIKCRTCWGKGWVKGPLPCPTCHKLGYTNK